MMSKALTFLKQAAVNYPNKNVLITSHAGIIRALLIKLGFATNQQLPHGAIGNLSYAVIQSDGVEFRVDRTEGINLQK